MTKPVDLDAIEARLAAATPGPWHTDTWDDSMFMRVYGVRAGNSQVITYDCNCHVSDESALHEADDDLIAHAPTDLAALVAEVKRLRAVAEAAQRLRGSWTDEREYGDGMDAIDAALDAWRDGEG